MHSCKNKSQKIRLNQSRAFSVTHVRSLKKDLSFMEIDNIKNNGDHVALSNIGNVIYSAKWFMNDAHASSGKLRPHKYVALTYKIKLFTES